MQEKSSIGNRLIRRGNLDGPFALKPNCPWRREKFSSAAVEAFLFFSLHTLSRHLDKGSCHVPPPVSSPTVATMAYPFPRFASAPQTPQHVQGIETPREAMSRNPSRHRSIKRGLIFLVTSTVVLIWWCGAFSKSSKQTDRVPFSHDLVEEQVMETLFSQLPLIMLLKLLQSFRRAPGLRCCINRPLHSTVITRRRWTKAISILQQSCEASRSHERRWTARV